MIFTIGFILMFGAAFLSVINDNFWMSTPLDKSCNFICNIGFGMFLYSLLTFAWNNMP